MSLKIRVLSNIYILSSILFFLGCARVEKIEQKDLQKSIEAREKLYEMQPKRGIVNLHNLSFRKKLEADIRKTSDWWTPLEVGEEVLILSEAVNDAGGIAYIEIQRTNLSKETGYARATFIARDARLAVVREREAFRYSSPSLTRLTKDTIPYMAIIAVYPQTLDADLIQFDYNDGDGVVFQKQYIEDRQISYLDRDIDAAKFFFLSKINQDLVLKIRFLQKAVQFKSTLFGEHLSDYLAILKGGVPASIAKDALKKISPSKKVKVLHSVTYYSQPSLDALALGMSMTDEVLSLVYETHERMSVAGKTASWFLVEKRGWVFGGDILEAKEISSRKEERRKKDKS
ncbi:MAG: hypothetical protein ACRCVN_07015 [Spirochaetia bacterium]